MRATRASMATFLVALVALGCGVPDAQPPTFDTERPASTVLTVALDSEWQVPSGFGIILPITHEGLREDLDHDRGDPPDQPEFSMWGEVPSGGELVQVTIAAFSDGASGETPLPEVLESFIGSFTNPDFAEPVAHDRNGLHIATARGNARHPLESPPQGVDLTVFFESETQKVWRLMCFASTEVVRDEVARICEEVRDGFRPLQDPYSGR